METEDARHTSRHSLKVTLINVLQAERSDQRRNENDNLSKCENWQELAVW